MRGAELWLTTVEMSSTETTHHISDVDTWGNPDRNYFTFVVLSIVGGFFGIDHLYLRSFASGTQKFFLNLLTFGLWYWWDLIQIYSDGATIRKEGLSSPFDWVRGIGRGVFTEEKEKTYAAKKSYLVYAFLAIFFGWLGADKFYLGEAWQGLAKLFSCFNIFIFLFGWVWVVWDAIHAFFLTDSILTSGIHAPMPYSMVFTKGFDGEGFKVTEQAAQEAGPFAGLSGNPLDWIAKWFHFPSVPTFPGREIYREIVAPLMTPPVVRALQSISTSRPDTSMPTASLPSMPTASLPSMNASMPTDSLPSMNASMPSMNASMPTDSLPSLPSASVNASIPTASMNASMSSPSPSPSPSPSSSHSLHPQTGGGGGPGPVIAGALTALVLAGGLKGFYDVISTQYG